MSTRRIVIKIGTSSLTGGTAHLDDTRMAELARQMAALIKAGERLILVSSGAIAAGREQLDHPDLPAGIPAKQMLAAVGQPKLMNRYELMFGAHGIKVAQLLLTREDISQRSRYLNARNTLELLLTHGILPIINENDTVSVKELRFGDNDTLAAMVSNMIEADLLICLTDVDGLYTANPATDPTASLLTSVIQVDDEVLAMAGNTAGGLGTGGMRSKILAARLVSRRGGSSCICSGRHEGTLRRLFAGEAVGTYFLPQEEKMPSRKHWIAYTLRPKGFLVLDEGAAQAVVGGGKSLLPSGILETRGSFRIGDPVHCLGRDGRTLAAGLVNYSSVDIQKIQGRHSNSIKDILGFMDCEEIIHRDNLVVL